MNTRTIGYVIVSALAAAVAPARAAEAPAEASSEAFAPRDTFGKWRVSYGWHMNGPVGSDIRGRNLPAPAGYRVPAGSATRAGARADAEARRYGDGYLGDSGDGWGTRDWQLPEDAYERENSRFVLRNGYEEVASSRVSGGWTDDSSDPCQHGMSLEFSRELWAHDEAFEHRWGVDLAFAVSYFFGRDVFRAGGYSRRDDVVREGGFETVIDDPDDQTMYLYNNGYDRPSQGMYGHGASYTDFSPMILWDNVRDPRDAGGTRTVTSVNRFSASGDYRELEMLLMLRPWYEITDWWRVFGELGVGLSWGNFESDVYGSGLSFGEDFSQWDCYGVAGLGTMFRYGMFDLSVDFLGRFLRDDLDVDGRYLNGSIRRADWCFRVMVGVEF